MSTVKQLRSNIKNYKNYHCPPYSNKKKQILINEAKRLGLDYKNKTVKQLKIEIKKYKNLHCYKIPRIKKELQKDLRRKFIKKGINKNIFKDIEKQLIKEKEKFAITQKEYEDIQNQYKKKNEDIFTFEEINNLVKVLPDYLIPVGSYIRKKKYPGDLDIVTTKNLNDVLKWFENNFKILKILAKGYKHIDLRIEYNGKSLGINIWNGTNDELPYLEFSYSYPQTLNIALRKKAKQLGYKLSQYQFLDSSGFLIPIKSFEDIFKKLNVEFRTPAEEEIRETKYKHIKDGNKALKLIRKSKKEKVKEELKEIILEEEPKEKTFEEMEAELDEQIKLLKQKKKRLTIKDVEKIYNTEKDIKDRLQEISKEINDYGLIQEEDLESEDKKQLKKLESERKLLFQLFNKISKKGSSLISGYNYNGGIINNIINEELEKQIKGGIDFLYPIKKGYQILDNEYRKNFCHGKSRPLKYGEIHPLCANFEGPGTRIDLPEVLNYPPYSPSDACAKEHDIAYSNAFKIKDSKLREQAIRKADEIIIQCLQEVKGDEPYRSLGLAGIEGKMQIEDLIPMLAKLISGKEYFGHK